MSDKLTADAIREITKLADDRRKPLIQRFEGDPAHCYWLFGADGKGEKFEAEPPLFVDKLERPDDCAAYVDKLAAAELAKAVVYYDAAGVVVLPNRDDIRWRVEAALAFTPQWNWLLHKSKEPLSQKALVRLLRIDFRGCFDGNPELLGLVRNLKFAANSQAQANLQHGKESMGRSIEAQVSGEATLPEEFTVTVPVWRQLPLTERVACAIEIFPEDQCFRLTPYPLELDKALDRALARLEGFLRGDLDHQSNAHAVKPPRAAVPVYRGRPVAA